MDATAAPSDQSAPWRPEGCDNVALVLQGGGALGAYQAGVYQALHEAGLEPDSIAGVSIGGINGAIIAGNPPDQRVKKLQEFWSSVTGRTIWHYTPDGDLARKIRNSWSSTLTTLLGQPGFFEPNKFNAWLSPRGSVNAVSFYDTSPLKETLLRLVDFELLNHGPVRYAAGAVNVLSGNFAFFDSSTEQIGPEHVMASGALPPAFPMIQIGADFYWDGGLVSNTPLQHVLDTAARDRLLVFQVDLFSARGVLPRDMHEVHARLKDIQYSSRTRLVTDYFRDRQNRDLALKRALEKIDEAQLDNDERELKRHLSQMPQVTILQLIYQQSVYESQSKDYEFSGTSMREHWDSGYRDTRNTLLNKSWLMVSTQASGIVVHDVHRRED
jgi:NTE family protein